MKKIKVMTIVGTRPEIIRLSRIIEKLDLYAEHTLVHTGQNYDYELNKIFFEDLNLRAPNYFTNSAKETSSETIGQIIIDIDKVLSRVNPDAVLVLGDTNSALSILAAKKKKIPTFHMEAGNRCFDMRVPEEINRKIIDHISDVNITYSTIARDYLLREGLNPDLVIKSGSPMKEVLNHNMDRILNSKILSDLNLKKEEFFLVSFHREENIDNELNLNKILQILNKLEEIYKLPIIVSTHPRSRKKIEGKKLGSLIKLLKPLSFSNYNFLQINSKAVISDSGTISEESSILNFPAINLREAHERPEAMEEASVIMVGLNIDRVFQALNIINNQKRRSQRSLRIVKDYDYDNISEKIVRLIISYTDYVNNQIWKKY